MWTARLRRPARVGRWLRVGVSVLVVALASAAAAALADRPARAREGASGCTTSGLVIWLYNEPGGGTAGSVFYKLELTNLSGHACTLFGYPGVSAVDLANGQLGAGASREAFGKPRTVTLAPGAGAQAVLRITDAGALPGCRPVTAAGLRVYPPGQSAAKRIPFPFQACSRAGHTDLRVRAITSGGLGAGATG